MGGVGRSWGRTGHEGFLRAGSCVCLQRSTPLWGLSALGGTADTSPQGSVLGSAGSSSLRVWKGRKIPHLRLPRHRRSATSESSVPVSPRPIRLSGGRWPRCALQIVWLDQKTHKGGQSSFSRNLIKTARKQQACDYNLGDNVSGLRNKFQNFRILLYYSSESVPLSQGRKEGVLA